MRKPVVFIPGYPGSKLKFTPENRTIFPPPVDDLLDPARRRQIVELLSDPRDSGDPVQPSEPIRSILGISKQADALYDLLSGRFGYEIALEGNEFRAVSWDWRKSIDHPQTRDALRGAIDDLHRITGRKVVVLPHSTGGLVLRRLLEAEPALAEKIDQIVAFGVPWCGTLASLQMLTNPQKIGLFEPLAFGPAEVDAVMSRAQAAFDLLPPDPTQTDMSGVNLFMENGAQAAPLLRTAWMRHAHMAPLGTSAHQRLGSRSRMSALPPVTNVVAWGAGTFTRATLAGADVSYDVTPFGDGTVPLASAAWLRGDVRTMHVPIGAYPSHQIPRVHSRIWDSPPVVQLLHEVLEDAPRRPFVAVSVDGNDFANASRRTVLVRITACDARGQALPNAKATFKFGGFFNFKTFPLGGVTAEVLLDRSNLDRNVSGTPFYRLPVAVKWDGGRADPDPVILFHVT